MGVLARLHVECVRPCTSREKYGMEHGLAVPCSRSSVLVVGVELEVGIEAWYGAW